MNNEASENLRCRLVETARAVLGENGEWSIEDDGSGYRLLAPDRTLVVERRPGPDGGVRWAVAVRVDGETVTKSGPFTGEELPGEVRALLDAQVRYTVCCDG